VLTFADVQTLLPIPRAAGQLLTQGSLPAALMLALTVNPRCVVRPNLFLTLCTVLAVLASMVSLHNQFVVGSLYRSARLAGFIAVLWLLTPWWGRRDQLLLRCHLRVVWVGLATVLVGLAVAPGTALAFSGRLSGVLWPVWPTQVAHLAAVLFGVSAVLWMCRLTSGRYAGVALSVSGFVLLATHTRTALVGTIVGLVVAAGSLFLGHVRVRRVSAIGVVSAILATTVFASQLRTWLLRGQSSQEASQLTGRTKAWAAVFDGQRPKIEEYFGSGLSNQSINGLPIDSSWVSTFYDQGIVGVVICASLFVVLMAMAATHERGPERAVALFLIGYVLMSSISESGVGTASIYLLDLTLAAALLAPSSRRRYV
jgi:hypothetical protein